VLGGLRRPGLGVLAFDREPKKPGRPAPDAIDVAVGVRIEQRRLALGLSRNAVAKELNVTSQQINKYEHGQNRISASTLIRMAGALQTSVSVLAAEENVSWPPGFDDFLTAYRHIRSDEKRAALLKMMRILAELP
jgi:transcriptional regulator with XRE-family HTH domain